jgi:hypothetical protein
MKNLLLVFCLIASTSSLHATEVLWNTTKEKSVLDLYTTPGAPLWKQLTSLYELCYRDVTAEKALEEIMFLKEEGILYYDDQVEQYLDSYLDGETIVIVVYNDKIEEDYKKEHHEINRCTF